MTPRVLSPMNVTDILLLSLERATRKRRRASFPHPIRLTGLLQTVFLALPIFAVVMFIVYYVSVTTVGAIVTDWTNDVLFGEITSASGH